MLDWVSNIWTKPLASWRLLDILALLILAAFTYFVILAFTTLIVRLSEESRHRRTRQIVKANLQAEKMRRDLGYGPKSE